MALILANSKYTYFVNGERYVGGKADLFDAHINSKSDIINIMINNIYDSLYDIGLVAIPAKHGNDSVDNNEDKQFLEFYDYRESCENYEDYINNYSPIGNESFGFIDLRIL